MLGRVRVCVHTGQQIHSTNAELGSYANLRLRVSLDRYLRVCKWRSMQMHEIGLGDGQNVWCAPSRGVFMLIGGPGSIIIMSMHGI